MPTIFLRILALVDLYSHFLGLCKLVDLYTDILLTQDTQCIQPIIIFYTYSTMYSYTFDLKYFFLIYLNINIDTLVRIYLYTYNADECALMQYRFACFLLT